MKDSLETALETYAIELAETHPALKRIPKKHSDHAGEAETNCIVFEASKQGENIPGHYDVDLEVDYRADSKRSPAQNKMVNAAIDEIFDTVNGGQSWTALHRTTIENQFAWLRIEEVTGSGSADTKSLRRRKLTVRFIARLLRP